MYDKFVIAFGVVVTLLLISFLSIRKTPRQPVKLNLSEPTVPPPQAIKPAAVKGAVSAPEAGLELAGATEKSLNVYFNWNGHSWDAFEVLGIPAGSSLAAAREALRKAVNGLDEDSQEFLKAAVNAIESTRK